MRRLTCLCAGMDCEAEDRDPVPGQFSDQDGKKVDVDLELSLCRRDFTLECGVDGLRPRRIDESREPEGFGGNTLPAPADPYTDFAFGLGGTAQGDARRPSEPGTGVEYPSALETLRGLESAMGAPAGVGATVDLVPMDIEANFSNSSSKRLSSGGGETQCRDLPGSNSLNVLPFQRPAWDFSTLPPPHSLSPAVTAAHDFPFPPLDLGSTLVTAPAQVRPPNPRVSATVSSSGMALGSGHPVSTLVDPDSAEMHEREIAGPRLFQPFDDDGME